MLGLASGTHIDKYYQTVEPYNKQITCSKTGTDLLCTTTHSIAPFSCVNWNESQQSWSSVLALGSPEGGFDRLSARGSPSKLPAGETHLCRRRHSQVKKSKIFSTSSESTSGGLSQWRSGTDEKSPQVVPPNAVRGSAVSIDR
jgi:hypothetical protein